MPVMLVYKCPRCDDEVLVETGFVPGHDICLRCSYENGIYIDSVRLYFAGKRHPEPLLWEGSD